MFKKALFFLSSLLIFATGFAEEVWTIATIRPVRNTYIVTMENGTVWKFQEDPGKTKYHTNYHSNGRGGGYSTSVPYHVPGRSSNNIKFFQDGDLIRPSSFDGHILVFKDEFYENPIGCSLEEYNQNKTATICEMDPKGYSFMMSDGQEWTFSWWQSWASYYWEVGDSLLPVRNVVINLDRMLKKEGSFYADPY